MNAYVFGLSPQRCALTTAVLNMLVASFALTRDAATRVSIQLLDHRSRPLRRRSAFSATTAAAAVESWESGTAHEIVLVAGRADAGFDEANFIALRRPAAERTLSATTDAYLHCLFSLPTDWRPLLSHVVHQLVPALQLSYAFVHTTERMLCASSELLFATSPECLPISTAPRLGTRVDTALERDRWIAQRSSEIGERLLDVYWINVLSGSLKDRVMATLDGSALGPAYSIEHLTSGSVLLRIVPEPMAHDDDRFVEQRRTARSALRDHCVLRDWSGFQ